VLASGLKASHRKQRAAAAQMLAQLGSEAAPALPALVQRLFESTPLVRDHVAPALARLLPTLSRPMQSWLCLLANPLLPPLANLRSALLNPQLPADVREEFARLCARRREWRKHIAAGNQGPAPLPDLTKVALDVDSVSKAVNDLLSQAEQAACKHRTLESERQAAASRARNKEAAWLLARLCEQLQTVLPTPPTPIPPGKKVRKG